MNEPVEARDAASAPPFWRQPRLWIGLIAAIVLVAMLSGEMAPGVGLPLLVVAVIGFFACAILTGEPPVLQRLAEKVRPQEDRVEGEPAVHALIAALPEPALLLTPTGEIRTANSRVALAIGPAKVGDPLSFLVRVPEVLEAVRMAAEDGIPRRVEFAERIPLDRWLEAHVVPVQLKPRPDASGSKGAAPAPAKPDGVLLTFRDLTAQRRSEQMRADFVANASHELRTPLASLSGFIETLLGPAKNDAAARERFLGIMGAQARRMSRLIDDLLSLSRIELNVHVRPDTVVDLCGILSHVRDTLGPLAQDRAITITLETDGTAMPVRGDRDELIRLFENLVENALKYGGSGQNVDVRIAREPGTQGDVAAVSVRDYGPGIAPEHLPRLTERFYRVDVAASRDQGGTGLGLAIVKHIVARHRGRLMVESAPGKGATFTVRLDLSDDAAKNSVNTAA
ncbi:two-component system phosphate regulon sensor histidine kinase PhoR [Azorhizobium sp. AG788]|uniref:ATP-binding protein n=1 Tax=Azorhizobium sp. AG788 TaxID=2183897 RepID=UPI001061E180|nr:ATP-binding protein [Azorhizobium sp. AG788]TDU00668.1 two-component system phosphate regulon sensor histidine kinase PhoR [Azorhizobium sp. AG788]